MICKACHRALKTPSSIAAEMGPCCQRKRRDEGPDLFSAAELAQPRIVAVLMFHAPGGFKALPGNIN